MIVKMTRPNQKDTEGQVQMIAPHPSPPLAHATSSHALTSPPPPRSPAHVQTINATLPYVKDDIPVVIVFRALGCEDDRAILEHVLYDFDDMEMMELLKPSLEKAMVVQKRDVS